MKDVYLAYAQGFELMSQAWSPLVKSATRANVEAMTFVNRRTRAYMEVPSRIARCRTPGDLFAEQANFWREAAEQYAETSRKMLEAWAPAMVPPAPSTRSGRPAARKPPSEPRSEARASAVPVKAQPHATPSDYIAFAEPKSSRGANSTRAPRKTAGNRPRLS